MSRLDDLEETRRALAEAAQLAQQLDDQAQEALKRRDPEAYRKLTAQAAIAWATKRRLASLVRAGGRPATGQVEQTIGGFAWSRRP